MRLILSDAIVRAILVNIFGGIARGDEVARGLVEARTQQNRDVPMVVRIVGTNADLPRRSCAAPASGIEAASSLDAAVERAVALAGAGRMSILVDRTPASWSRASPAVRACSTPADAGLRHEHRRRHDARQGRPDASWTRRCPCSTPCAEAVAQTGANTSVIYVPAAGAPDAILEAVDAGIGTIFCITEHIPALDMLKVVAEVARQGRAAHRPQLPRRDVAGQGQGRHHPGLHPRRGTWGS